MKQMVLVDGENFRHQIANVLLAKEMISDKNTFFKFNVADFFKEVISHDDLEIIYYTTKIKQPSYKVPQKLTTLIGKISIANRKWIAQLSNQNAKVIKAGHLRIRESNSCINCGKKTLVLQEKGVDVRVATDLVLSSKAKKSISLVSSDSDLTPAIQAAKRMGTKLQYICYAGQLNRSVAACSDIVITFTDKDIIKYFGKKNG